MGCGREGLADDSSQGAKGTSSRNLWLGRPIFDQILPDLPHPIYMGAPDENCSTCRFWHLDLDEIGPDGKYKYAWCGVSFLLFLLFVSLKG